MSKSHARLLALFSALVLSASACGGDDGEADGSTEAMVVTHAASSTNSTYIPQYRAPELYGDRFGISTDEHLTAFESHTTAAQIVAGGRADVGSGGLVGLLQLRQEGQDFKIFCPNQKGTTQFIVGATERITSLEQIRDPDIRVAVDSPGGLINFIMNLVFHERGMDITVDDLENISILEDSPLRASALANGDVDVASIDILDIPGVSQALGGEDALTVLAIVAEESDFLANMVWAPTEWLEDNTEVAARYCATILYSNRQLAADFDEYKSVLDRYVEGGISEDEARTVWEFQREHVIWPYNTDIINEENIRTQIEIAVDSGSLEESALDFAFEDVVHTASMEMAMELLGGPIDPQEVIEGNV